MNTILESRGIILDNIENIFKEYYDRESDFNERNKELNEEISNLTLVNKKLINEINEKDKLLLINDRKMVDYEVMINKIQEEASKELTEKERFSMLKAKDKAINERDIEIRRLQKRIDTLEEQIEKSSNSSDNIEVVVEEKKTLVERIKEIKDEEDVEDVVEETPVVDKDKEDIVEETPVVDKDEEDIVEETPVVDKDEEDKNTSDGEETEELSSEEGEEVEIITHYKKDYYIIVGEKPQYIYAIEDGELGDKVGEMENGKKNFYKSSKK